MSQLDGFDPEKESSGFEPIPAGQYRVLVTQCEMKPTANGNYSQISCKFQVLGGEFQNRTIYGNYNYSFTGQGMPGDKQKEAVRIGRGKFAELCKSVGILKPKSCLELVNSQTLATVEIKKGNEEFGDKNAIKKFAPVTGQAIKNPDAAANGNGQGW